MMMIAPNSRVRKGEKGMEGGEGEIWRSLMRGGWEC